jgi:hypothetical protein
MNRRVFIKTLTVLGFLGINNVKADEDSDYEEYGTVRIWSYYVPLTSYSGIIENFEGKNPQDLKVIFNEVIKKTDRISGKETDGTKNQSFELSALQAAPESLRVHFWHDDNGKRVPSGHCLYIYKRYLEDLEKGNNVFVATGMYQGHFHVVMLQPKV